MSSIDFDEDWKLFREPSSPASCYFIRLVCTQDGREVSIGEKTISDEAFDRGYPKEFELWVRADAEMTCHRVEVLNLSRKVIWTKDISRHLLLGDTLSVKLNLALR